MFSCSPNYRIGCAKSRFFFSVLQPIQMIRGLEFGRSTCRKRPSAWKAAQSRNSSYAPSLLPHHPTTIEGDRLAGNETGDV